MASTVQLSTKAFVTKTEIREAIFVDTSEVSRTDDELNTLYGFVNWVSDALEAFIGAPIIQKSVTEYNDGGGEYIFLTSLPVVTVSSVTEKGIALAAGTDYVYDPDYIAVRKITTADAYVASTFLTGSMANKVIYVSGYGTQTRDGSNELTSVSLVPEDFKLATYIWVQHLWAKGPQNYSPEQGEATGGRAAIPYAVKELMRNRIPQVHWIGS